jgi:predicted transcriptional regulator
MKTLVKEEAQRLLQTLPDDATWDDVQYAILFRQSIARGMADSEAGRGKSSEEVRQHFAKKFGA